MSSPFSQCRNNKQYSSDSDSESEERIYTTYNPIQATFFILPDLTFFDAIIALDLLKQVGVSLCLASGQLKWGTEVEQIDFHTCPDFNFTNVDCSDAPPSVKSVF